MDRRDQYLFISVILLLTGALIIGGCVEVTPPSGSTEASAYGSSGNDKNLTYGLDKTNETPTPQQSSVSPDTPGQGSPAGESAAPGPDSKIPAAPDPGLVKVTPRSLEGLPSATPTQPYSALTNPAATGGGEELVTIYEMNYTFANNAVAYAYALEHPPLYVAIDFSPEIGTDVISYQKRTGDKEGQIDVTVNRPLKDSWFEMRVYNLKDGSEVLREGYGKTYSQSNKTFALRSTGSYQFDMLGNLMNATVRLKVPLSMADLYNLQNVSGMISSQKENEAKVPGVFLVIGDLPAGWEAVGDVTRTDTNYQSMFQKDYITLRQKIIRYDGTDKALAELETLKSSAGGTTAPSLVGQSGFQLESASKTQVAFVQGVYLVELSSFSAPDHVSLTDLQNFGKIIAGRISSG